MPINYTYSLKKQEKKYYKFMILIIESYVKDNNGANTIFNCRLSTFDI